jgi:hypothetical protein
MAIVKFNDAETDLLLSVMLEHTVKLAAEFSAAEDDLSRALLLEACRIIAELHQPTAVLPDVKVELQPFDVEPYIRTLTEAEGIDLGKELGPMDPRAFTPRCTHGKLFSEACSKCQSRCPHGLTEDEPCAGCGRGVAPAHPGTFIPDPQAPVGMPPCNCGLLARWAEPGAANTHLPTCPRAAAELGHLG